MKAVRILMMGALLAGVMVSGGCPLLLVGGAVAGTAAYLNDTEATVDGTVEQVTEAAKAVVTELGLTVIPGAAPTKVAGNVVARNSEDKKLEIDVKYVTDTTSKISIRKGFFGDQATQQQVMDKIKEKLKG